MSQSWTPPFTLAERIKYALIPPWLYMWRLLRKHARKGEAELKLLPALVARDKIAIDIGANKGVYTHLLARLCQRVEAFEPNPKIFGVLTRYLSPNVIAHHVALSDRAGVAELVIPARSSGGYSNQGASLSPLKKESAPHGFASVSVEARTLDSYNFTNVGFIKIDVEGFEEAVLHGAAETLKRERPTVLLELEERHTGKPIEASLADLSAMGFDVFFVRAGVLQPIAAFSAESDHRGRYKQPNYVFNFVLKPR